MTIHLSHAKKMLDRALHYKAFRSSLVLFIDWMVEYIASARF